MTGLEGHRVVRREKFSSRVNKRDVAVILILIAAISVAAVLFKVTYPDFVAVPLNLHEFVIDNKLWNENNATVLYFGNSVWVFPHDENFYFVSIDGNHLEWLRETA